ncbi:sporulation and cell division repeat protein [Treponema phagedenis F0421]|uniref:SPOR domain-containing protein n=1 Tax=Treponema phagedenis TaxID=162 RepID=UPI0001F6433B|nr:SPOR domain-containing protein [Treponema phagedenis]EFW38767.1 sporulation and cell division repeat protein [Treponema phagedenis F0421]
MKKIIVFISIFLISFSSLWAVWEGNAAAGISADFPSDGMFVRSDMFPKHTLVEIINLEKDIKVRAVVIGTAGIPGLLASLSPKVANELKIDSKKTARIRIFIPTHVRELGEDESDLSLPEYAQDNTLSVEIVKKDDTHTESVFYDEPEISLPEESAEILAAEPEPEIKETPEPIKKETIVYVEPVKEKPAKPAPVKPPVEEKEKPPVPQVYLEPVPTVPKVSLHPAAPRYPQDNQQAELSLRSEKVAVVVSPTPPEKPEPETPSAIKNIDSPQNPPEKKHEEPSPVAGIEIPSAPEKEEPKEPAEVISLETPSAPEMPLPADPASVDSVDTPQAPREENPFADEPVAVVDSPVQPLPEKKIETEEKPEEVEELKTPETIDPVEETPEEAEDSSMIQELSNISQLEIPVPEKTEEEKEPIKEIVIPEIEKPQKPPKVVEEPYIGKLKKGEYYVQIAIYTDIIYVQSIMHRYGKDYPITVEKETEDNKNRFKVFVGPIQRDERGAVLENFQKRGFKDAFLKKIF